MKLPPFRRFFPYIIICVTALVIFIPPLLLGKVVVQEFTLHHQYGPLVFAAHESARGNPTPLWTGGYSQGYPLFQSAFAYFPPFTYLLSLFDVFTLFTIASLCLFCIGGFVTYRFARLLGLSELPACAAALIYTFNQVNLAYDIFPLTLMVAIVPILFYATLSRSQGNSWPIAYGSIALAIGWYSAFSEYVVYTGFFVALFAFFLDIIKSRDLHRVTLVTSLSTLFMLCAGTVIALPRLIPIASFVTESARSHGAMGATDFFLPSDLVFFFFPHFWIPFAQFIPLYHNNVFTLCLGFVPLFAMTIFFGRIRRFVSDYPSTIFFGGLFLLGFLMLFEYTGVFYFFRYATHNLFGGAWKLLFLSYFGLAIVSGHVLEWMKQSDSHAFVRQVARVWMYILSVILVFIVTLTTILSFGATALENRLVTIIERAFSSSVSSGSLEHYRTLAHTFIDALGSNLSFVHFDFVGSFILLVFSVFVAYVYSRATLSPYAYAYLIGLVVATPMFFWFNLFPSAPRELVTSSQTSTFLENRDPSTFRIFRFWPGIDYFNRLGLASDDVAANTEIKTEYMMPNTSMLFGIESADGDDNYMSYRQSKLAALIGSTRAPQNADLQWINASSSRETKLARFTSLHNRQLLGMMNVRYVISSLPFPSPWINVFQSTTTYSKIPIIVYENPDVISRFYFARDVTISEPNERLAYSFLETNDDFTSRTFIECETSLCSSIITQPDPNDTISVVSYTSNKILLNATTTHDRWLIIANAHVATWDAIISSPSATSTLSAPVHTANYIQQAILVPSGVHTITLTYPKLFRQTLYAVLSLISH